MIIFEDLTPDELFNEVQINIEDRKEQEFENGYELLTALDNIDPTDNNINIWWHSYDSSLGDIDFYLWPFTDLYENVSLNTQLNRDGYQEIYSEGPVNLKNRQEWWDNFKAKVFNKFPIEINIDYFDKMNQIED